MKKILLSLFIFIGIRQIKGQNIPINIPFIKDYYRMMQLMGALEWRQQIDSTHPYSRNDDAMIPAKGYQTLLSAGIFVKTIRLTPEYIYAANRKFLLSRRVLSGVDLPQCFHNNSFSKALWGQSSIRLNFGPASAGISNGNLCWRWGRISFLIKSNSASGFKQSTLNTMKSNI